MSDYYTQPSAAALDRNWRRLNTARAQLQAARERMEQAHRDYISARSEVRTLEPYVEQLEAWEARQERDNQP